MEDQENEQLLNDQLNGIEPEEVLEDDPIPDEEENEIEEDDPIEEPEPEKKPSRAESRIQALSNEKKTAEAERELAKAQADFYRRQAEELQKSISRPKEDEYIDPQEKQRRQEEEWRNGVNQTLQQVQFNSQDALDRSTFISKFSGNPSFSTYINRVEVELQKARANGQNAPREQVLRYLIGQDAIEKMEKVPAIKREAAARVKQAQGKPLGTKSNVATSKSVPSLEDRLRDVIL